uniref:Uncharacterized protein n=1 Tax=Macrostomum lignano TaxID=282301 RepID=A0A1I8JQN4_9PLAT
MPFNSPSHRLCTLLLCLAVLSGSSTGFLLLKEDSSATTTDSLTNPGAVEAGRYGRRPSAELLKPNRQPLKPPPQLLQRISVAEPAQRMPVAKRMTGSNLDALKARLIGRGYLPPGASDEELARLVRNLIDVYSRRRRQKRAAATQETMATTVDGHVTKGNRDGFFIFRQHFIHVFEDGSLMLQLIKDACTALEKPMGQLND